MKLRRRLWMGVARWLPLAFLLLWAVPHAALAAQTVYTIRDVPVDVTADTADAARKTAMADAQAEAWRRLTQRLVPDNQQNRIPTPTADQLDSIVQSLEVSNEKITAQRYRAFVTVRFRRDGVQGILDGAGLTYAATPAPVLVVLPVLENGGQASLWEDTNAWLQAWQNVPARDDVVDLVVPVGDLQDIAAIDAKGAIDGDWSRMEALAGRYKADGVVVAEARTGPGSDASGPTLKVTWYEGAKGRDVPILRQTSQQSTTTAAATGDVGTVASDLNGQASAGNGQTSAATGQASAGSGQASTGNGQAATASGQAATGSGQGSTGQDVGGSTGQLSAKQLAAAVDLVRRSVDAQWSAISMVPQGPQQTLIADVPISGLKQWLDIRNRLSEPASVVGEQPLVISTGKVRILLRYVGDLDKLQAGLNQAGLDLSQQDGSWTILPM